MVSIISSWDFISYLIHVIWNICYLEHLITWLIFNACAECFWVLFMSILKIAEHLSFPYMFYWIQLLRIFVIKRVRACKFFCHRLGCYHNASKEQARYRIFKFMLQWCIRFLNSLNFFSMQGKLQCYINVSSSIKTSY